MALSVPPTFHGNLRKQRILQQSLQIITCRVAYHNLFLSRRDHKLKKMEKHQQLSNKSSVILRTGKISYSTGAHLPPAYTIR